MEHLPNQFRVCRTEMFHVEHFTHRDDGSGGAKYIVFSNDESGQRELETELLPYLLPNTLVPAETYAQLTRYLELLLKWNIRTNLTAIRDPQEIVRRHFGESVFAAQHIGECSTLLDFGSGAGFPGLPIQLVRPDIHVTLAESQNKKATFLREVIRSLDLTTEVWANRVEAMSAAITFDVVALRAVDNMDTAIEVAASHTERKLVLLTTPRAQSLDIKGFAPHKSLSVPGSRDKLLVTLIRT